MNIKNNKSREYDALSLLNVLFACLILLFSIASYFFIHSNVVLFTVVNLVASIAHLYFVYLAASCSTPANVTISLLFFALSAVLKFPVKFV